MSFSALVSLPAAAAAPPSLLPVIFSFLLRWPRCGPSVVVGFLWKTQVRVARLSGHSEVFSALELRGKSITIKESIRYKASFYSAQADLRARELERKMT